MDDYNNSINLYSKQKMRSRFYRGLLLICMMFGHNYVLNQAQSMQTELQELHELNVTQFNFLYAIPSAFSILLIIPLGILYDSHAQRVLMFGAFALLIGQILVVIFGPSFDYFEHSFLGMIIGRILEGTGAEVLYMIQGNLASTWMSKAAGMIFILPECGQIANVLITPIVSEKFGIFPALLIGLFACIISFVACILMYRYLQKYKGTIELVNSPPTSEDGSPREYNTVKALQQDKNSEALQQYPPGIEHSIEEKYKQSEIDAQVNEQKPINEEKQKQQTDAQPISEQPKSIWKAGKVFWLILAVCTVNQCLYFPFLDNANVLIQTRFCVPHKRTGMYLCLPFICAILTTFFANRYILGSYSRKILIIISSSIPLMGHLLIYFNRNCELTITLYEEVFLVAGLMLFGMGLGAYYSVSFPSVGLAVPEKIRGTGYACLCFCQTIAMTVVPEISGIIIEQDEDNNDNFIQGYKNSSFFFVCLCALGVFLSFFVYFNANEHSFSHDDYHNKNKNQENSTQVNMVEMKTTNSSENDTSD